MTTLARLLIPCWLLLAAFLGPLPQVCAVSDDDQSAVVRTADDASRLDEAGSPALPPPLLAQERLLLWLLPPHVPALPGSAALPERRSLSPPLA